MKTHRLTLLALASTASIAAQTAPPTPTPTSPEAVMLESFVVNTDKDSGYIAVDSLAGGRTATPIKLTPIAISSLTRTFLDDVAITDVREALKWTVNVVPSDLNAGKSSSPFNDWDFNFRGAGLSQGQHDHGNAEGPDDQEPDDAEIEGEAPAEAFHPGDFEQHEPKPAGHEEPR